MAITTLRPLRPRRAILLRKDAQLGLFGGETEVKPTAAAKRRERMLQPKAPPKPPKPSTRATAPKEGDTRINRAGNEEVLRAGRWRLASNPKVVAKDKGSAAIVPVVEAEKPMPEVEGTLKPKGGSKPKSKREPINAGRAGKGRIRTAAQIEAIEQAQAVAREAIQRSDYKSGRERADRIVQTRQLVEVMSSGSGQRWTPSTIDGQKIAIFPDNPLGEGDTPHRMYLEGDKAGIVEPHELDEKPEPAEVVDDAPKPTKLGDRIRAIANDLRDENDEQKKIAARILGAAAQMAQNYDNLVGEVVDMVGEDLGEDIRSLNPDATQADVEMVARDGGSEPSPTRLADKMKAIADDLRNETNEQVKATARILDAAAQIAQNYDNLVDEVAEMVGEDLEAGGDEIAPAEAPPTKQEDINALKEFAEMRHWRGKDSLRLDPAMLDQFPDFKQYLIATGFIQAEDGSFFILDSASPLPSQIASDFPEVAEIDERHRQEKLEREAARAKEEESEEPSPVPSPSKEPSKKGLNFLPTPEHVENFQRQVKAKFFGSPKKQAIQRNQIVLLDALDLLKQELMSSGWPVDEQKEYLSDLLNVGIWDDPNNLDGVKSGKDLMMMLENVMESAERQEAFARGAGVPAQADADAVMDWIEATDFKGSEKQVKWAKDIARKNAGKIAQLKAQGKTIPTDARWWIDNRSNNILLEISDLTKSLPPSPVFTLMGVPYIFDPSRAVLRKAGTSWEQFVADLSKEADGDPCWEGYEAVGMKKKRGKMVPNCVPVNR
jgi:hypothetical protein